MRSVKNSKNTGSGWTTCTWARENSASEKSATNPCSSASTLSGRGRSPTSPRRPAGSKRSSTSSTCATLYLHCTRTNTKGRRIWSYVSCRCNLVPERVEILVRDTVIWHWIFILPGFYNLVKLSNCLNNVLILCVLHNYCYSMQWLYNALDLYIRLVFQQ